MKNVTEKFCGLRFRFEKNQGKLCEEGMEGCGCEWECVVLFWLVALEVMRKRRCL